MEKTKEGFSESLSVMVIILFALLGKILYEFKTLGNFNYPLLIKIIYLKF